MSPAGLPGHRRRAAGPRGTTPVAACLVDVADGPAAPRDLSPFARGERVHPPSRNTAPTHVAAGGAGQPRLGA